MQRFSINLADAKETLCTLLDENTHKNERLGQYAFNIFEIIIDKLTLILISEYQPKTMILMTFLILQIIKRYMIFQ